MIVTSPQDSVRSRTGATALVVGLLAAVVLLVASASASGATASQLRRYPYLSDAAGSSTTVNWATDRSATTATVTWGPAGSSCNAGQATATRTSITVNGVGEYQWKATLSGLIADRPYCYRVQLGATDLLGTDASPLFTAPPPASSSSYRFAVFGDTGRVDSTGANPDQANLMSRIGASGARFSLFTGDIPYVQSGQTTETAYGDLSYSLSGVFASRFWAGPGRSIPFFPALGNHGLSSSFLSNWPAARAAAASGGRYQMDTYSGADGTTSASYPSGWYAFDVGNARVYILDAAWANSNIGTAASNYQADFDYHWNPAKAGCTPACGEQYRWLQQDLANHPSALKFAVFHFPLYSDNATETSDPYLRADGPAATSSLESLLSRNGVDIVFNGHAHLYERNTKQNGMVSYVTGGGGAETEPVTSCSAFDAYAIGFSSRGGTSCNAPKPTSVAQVVHFLLVSVNGTSVTVTPTDSTGRTFDAQTYSFAGAADTAPPSTPTGVSATAQTQTSVSLSWNASTDNVGVTGYEVSVDGGAGIATATTSFTAAGLACGTSHTFRVAARDAAGNVSAQSAAVAAGTGACTPPPPPPSGIAFVRQATGGVAAGTSFAVPLASGSGDALVASVAIKAGSTVSVKSVSDSGGGTWTKGPIGFLAGSSTRVELWYRTGASAVTAVSVTLSGSSDAAGNVSEYSGVAAIGALDAQAGAGNASSTTAPTPLLATTNARDLVVGAVNWTGSATASLAGTAFTSLSSFSVSTTVNGRAAYRLPTVADTFAASWTLSKAAASGGAILALKGA